MDMQATKQETADIMYIIGRIFARLEAGGAFAPDDQPRQYTLVSGNPARHLPPLVARLIERGKGDMLADLMAQIPTETLPGMVSGAGLSAFGLGYYHQKAQDRPREGGRPAVYDEPRTRVYLSLTDRLLAALDKRARARDGGNRTAAIERLLREALGLPPLTER
ncbi:MAG: ribbon-helix-helix protein, CopG family [Ktedonobacterales bacterium]|nr:ribbon-helix-helix protein, CopG family [Ktedonobacterales bacterium]